MKVTGMAVVEQLATDDGIPIRRGWKLDRIKAYTKLQCKFWLDDVYDYYAAAEDVKYMTGDPFNNTGGQELDQFIWEEWTNTLEESRQFVFESFLSFGINEVEAHFLSIKFVLSTISKFRVKMFIEFGGEKGKEDFRRTALRNAVNFLARRFLQMRVSSKYLWSVEAVDERLGQFRKEAAAETARILVEDVGSVFHAKLTL